jgi:tight adherence protein B
VADTVRARAAVEREVRALASSARASSGVLVATPLAFAVAVAILDGRVRAFLGTPAGLACLLGGAVLDLLGGWWMRRQIAAVA